MMQWCLLRKHIYIYISHRERRHTVTLFSLRKTFSIYFLERKRDQTHHTLTKLHQSYTHRTQREERRGSGI